jgi:hypothetical protein
MIKHDFILTNHKKPASSAFHYRRTELTTLGEFGLIKHLTEHVEIHNDSSIKGIGDDAAVIKYNGEKHTLDFYGHVSRRRAL